MEEEEEDDDDDDDEEEEEEEEEEKYKPDSPNSCSSKYLSQDEVDGNQQYTIPSPKEEEEE